MEQISGLEQMEAFVKNYIESHDPIGTSLDVKYPFRRRFDHCLRCAAWARRIAPAENADLETCVVAALFHDVAKSEQTETRSHSEIGAEVCDRYLTSIGYDKDKKDRIVTIVRHHSNHDKATKTSPESKVVSDTDLLDEIGALTVLWDTMACAREDEPSYDKVYERLAAQYSRLNDGLIDWFHTETAKEIFKGRLLFLDSFSKNLSYELGQRDTPE